MVTEPGARSDSSSRPARGLTSLRQSYGGPPKLQRRRKSARYTASVAALLLLAALWTPASAQRAQSGISDAPGDAASAKPGILGRIGIDQRLNHRVPLDLPFVDESGRDVRLGDYFGKRPVILALVYYECPMLCTQVLNGLTSALSVMNFEPGREFDVVAVSFNPREGPGLASQKKKNYIERYGRPQTAPGWHFLTGREDSIKRLTEAIGFRYAFDEKIGQFAHGAAIEVLTPRGTIARYFYGIEFSARDLRLGVIEAADEKIGTPIDDFLLLCYHYDPATGKYGAAVLRLVRLGAIATVLVFASFLAISLRRERQNDRHGAADGMSMPSGGSLLPPDDGAKAETWGSRERPSRGSGRSPV